MFLLPFYIFQHAKTRVLHLYFCFSIASGYIFNVVAIQTTTKRPADLKGFSKSKMISKLEMLPATGLMNEKYCKSDGMEWNFSF